MPRPERAEASGLGDLEPGTVQYDQLSARIADIAWTALCVIAALWTVLSAVGALSGAARWAYSVEGLIVLAIALGMRYRAVRRRTRLRGR
ncbi:MULTISPECIES: hypothetical protein [Streptomyces]|uniref:DUF2530 domain-containing protein n=2 Tax=Streptomyces TaxID=1883 RepID=A0A2U9PC45_STRAS|nr:MULTISPECIES: hypothetical protein [Streptomyces]AWT47123.1 hypothetical protein DMT42_35990 [Streptomyces actuosus]MBM4823684.1 hypothetical protein [Streptomyces actuosus]GHF38815.1 hypothetical protein GCM10018783_04150 [Streptomyces griseosporeus]